MKQVCICKTADPAWVAEDARLLEEYRRLKAEYGAMYEVALECGWDPSLRPTGHGFPPTLSKASDAVYGPDGICWRIERHRYGDGAFINPEWKTA